MENKINIAKFLKNCPEDMELNCTVWENLYFKEITNSEAFPISCYFEQNGVKIPQYFTKYGCCHSNDNAKCVIFPKGKNTWEGFVPPYKFKDGDIVCTTLDNIAILKNKSGLDYSSYSSYSSYCGVFSNDGFAIDIIVSPIRLATEEEKQRLFKTIKEKGYKWDAKTKTLEKLQELLKFKNGDVVTSKDGRWIGITLGGEPCNFIPTYCVLKNRDKLETYLNRTGDGEWSFNRLATEEEKARLFKAIEKSGYKWNAETKTLEKLPNKFDTSSLIPYESKVLVRNSLDGYWKPAFWGAYVPENPERHQNRNFLTTLGFTRYCIPFEGNEALTGTTNDCNEFYKIWEE